MPSSIISVGSSPSQVVRDAFRRRAPAPRRPRATEHRALSLPGRPEGLGIAVVTNGYHLTEYLGMLEKASIREIQVTLDGVGRSTTAGVR